MSGSEIAVIPVDNSWFVFALVIASLVVIVITFIDEKRIKHRNEAKKRNQAHPWDWDE